MTSQSPQTICIVDDNRRNIHVLVELLREHDYSVRFALNGASALSLLQKSPLPDLILLDIMMPEMDGYHVCRCLKHDVRTSAIPVVFVSALDESEAGRSRAGKSEDVPISESRYSRMSCWIV